MTDRNQLQDSYIHHLLENMEVRDLEIFFLETMAEDLDRLSITALLEEIKSYAPELLEANK